ncbi:hypothetical protein J7E25_11885 [Agromyces sp. ISL-38]|uniref:hypothetical protein n=1 Tax=Agromyces sp. ISL-38 TaxID=2819107 RepID=UPI001BE86F21|nr:hypothetical protein [Agromyces sp. ISL-38]MBT2499795.1 hypothetical protein [Agromyces sp. ISL-38]
MNASNPAYRVGAILPAAIADDLAASGLTFSPGRGHGYRLRGVHIDSYRAGDVIEGIFAEAAAGLRYYLDTDPVMLAIAADEAALLALPYRDRDADRARARSVIASRIEAAEASLPISRAQLVLARGSLAATARSVRGVEAVRREALRRFRSVIPAPASGATASSAELDAFLLSLPPGPIARPELHAAALAAGLTVGPRTLYAAADALGWPVAVRRGVRRYRVPSATP